MSKKNSSKLETGTKKVKAYQHLHQEGYQGHYQLQLEGLKYVQSLQQPNRHWSQRIPPRSKRSLSQKMVCKFFQKEHQDESYGENFDTIKVIPVTTKSAGNSKGYGSSHTKKKVS